MHKLAERKSPTSNQCSLGHKWNDSDVTYLIMPAKKVLRPLPQKYPRDLSFTVCWDMINKKSCGRTVCSFAHSTEETKVWQWMAKNKGTNA